MTDHRPLLSLLAACALSLASAPAALAAPNADETGSTTVEDPNFGAFTAIKKAEFFRDSNPADPFPGDGHSTYVYTLTNDSSSQIALIGLEVEILPGTADAVVSAGFLAGSGVAPLDGGADTTNVGAAGVSWSFVDDVIDPGEVSAQLYIVSDYDPGAAGLTVNGDFALNAEGVCNLIPAKLVGTPTPCTIGFWKNREAGRKGLLQFFPDGEFAAVKAEAVALSSVFASEAELVTALTSKGRRTIEERAKQQLSALLLNLAAGSLFPDNTKCKLFTGNPVDTDGDGAADLTVGEALTQIESDILSGDPALQEAAKDFADDINNGIGVLGATSS